MCCFLCMTTAASHQYLPLSCPTTPPSVEEQSHKADLSRPLWCLVLKEKEVKFHLLQFPLLALHQLFIQHLLLLLNKDCFSLDFSSLQCAVHSYLSSFQISNLTKFHSHNIIILNSLNNRHTCAESQGTQLCKPKRRSALRLQRLF